MSSTLRMILEESAADDRDAVAAALWAQMTAQAVVCSASQPGSQPGRSPNVERGFEQGHLRIMLDYFWPPNNIRPDGSSQYCHVFTDNQFERRFRMSRAMFDRVFEATTADNTYLRAGLAPNCTGKLGASPLQKVVAALRQLAYGCSADSLDEYCRLGESTALRSMKEFCQSVVACFESEYLRDPTEEEVRQIQDQFARVGFPGCVGCLDCAGWEWQACPKGLQGIMIGKDGVPTLRMEVISDLDLRIWYLSFGLPGVMNDLNILSVSPYFGRILSGQYPDFEVKYNVGDEEFTRIYYLIDGICLCYKIFVKTIGTPTTRKDKLYCTIQEGARKSVERVFGVLFKQFAIMYLPGRLCISKPWFSEDMTVIAKACCILHNMTVEERKAGFVGDGIDGKRVDDIEADDSFPILSIYSGMMGFENVAATSVRSEEEHYRLKEALFNHIWLKHGSEDYKSTTGPSYVVKDSRLS